MGKKVEEQIAIPACESGSGLRCVVHFSIPLSNAWCAGDSSTPSSIAISAGHTEGVLTLIPNLFKVTFVGCAELRASVLVAITYYCKSNPLFRCLRVQP